MESPNASGCGWDAPEPWSGLDEGSRMPQHPDGTSTFGVDRFRQGAETCECEMNCSADPRELTGEDRINVTISRELLRAQAAQFREWHYLAGRNAAFAHAMTNDIVNEAEWELERSLKPSLASSISCEGRWLCWNCGEQGHTQYSCRAECEGTPIGHVEDRSPPCQARAIEQDACEAHTIDAAEAHPIEDAAEAHESTVDCPGFRRRAKGASVAEGEPHVPEDTSRGVTLEREPAGGDAAVITASCSGATFVGKSAGSEDEDDNLERLLVATPAVTGVGKSAGSEDDDDNLERLLVATPAVTIVEYSAGLEGDYLERFFVATPAVTWSKTAKQAFRRAAAAQWKAEQSWIGARRRPWTGVREALDTG